MAVPPALQASNPPWFGAVHRPTAATRLWLPSPKSGGAEAHRFLVRLRDLQSLIRPGAPVQESATIVPPPRPRVALWPPAVARCARWWKFVGDTKPLTSQPRKPCPLHRPLCRLRGKEQRTFPSPPRKGDRPACLRNAAVSVTSFLS